jgi:hypothetical protein
MKNKFVFAIAPVLIFATACSFAIPVTIVSAPAMQDTPILIAPEATPTPIPTTVCQPIPTLAPTLTPTPTPTQVPQTQPIKIVWNGVATDLQFNQIVVKTTILKLNGRLAYAKPGFWFVIVKGVSWNGAKNIENWPRNQIFATDNNNNIYPWNYRCVLSADSGNICWSFEMPVGSLIKSITLPGNLEVSLKPFWNLHQ